VRSGRCCGIIGPGGRGASSYAEPRFVVAVGRPPGHEDWEKEGGDCRGQRPRRSTRELAGAGLVCQGQPKTPQNRQLIIPQHRRSV
jgi:hypothetical protein